MELFAPKPASGHAEALRDGGSPRRDRKRNFNPSPICPRCYRGRAHCTCDKPTP